MTSDHEITYDVLLNNFFIQFWAFSELLNDSNGQVETWKYADYIIHSLSSELKRRFPDVKYPNGEKPDFLLQDLLD